MKRDPHGPIPGFEDEFTGTVGKEKRVHRTHFNAPEIDLVDNLDTGFEWVKIGQKYHLLPKKRATRERQLEVS
jgi:hypothetical protein